jgi:hypothetical protein
MGNKALTMTGARGKLFVNGKLIGLFSNVSYGVTLGLQPIYTLGRYNAQELVYTDYSPIDVRASGFRVIDHGPHQIDGSSSSINSVPMLQDLLNHSDISLTIADRQSGKDLLTVTGVRPTGYDSASSARGLHELNVSFMGIVASDEFGVQEDVGATTLV